MNNNIYLKHDSFYDGDSSSGSFPDSKNNHNSILVKNNILLGLVLLIGIVGFFMAFTSPKDTVYNNSSLENSFSNGTSSLASSSYQNRPNSQRAISFDMEKQFEIKGFKEVGEALDFRLENFQPNTGVTFTIHFGNGQTKEITEKSTWYHYSKSGNYQVKITANYEGATKEVYKEKIFIDNAIIVNTEAFTESN